MPLARQRQMGRRRAGARQSCPPSPWPAAALLRQRAGTEAGPIGQTAIGMVYDPLEAFHKEPLSPTRTRRAQGSGPAATEPQCVAPRRAG